MKSKREPEIPADYTEYGVEKGAKLESGGCRVESPDVWRIFEAMQHRNMEELKAWMDEHLEEFASTTVLVDTDDGDSLSQYRERHPKLFVQRRGLNLIRHLNTFLNRANETLEEGGLLWCHARTAVLKRRLIMERYPWGIRHIVFGLHFLWHRMFPKMALTKGIYFGITKGKNRTYNRVELLGRMYRAGFEVVDEDFHHGEFFVLARKVKAPIAKASAS